MAAESGLDKEGGSDQRRPPLMRMLKCDAAAFYTDTLLRCYAWKGILFLIADFLSRETPCQEAAELLRRELVGGSYPRGEVGAELSSCGIQCRHAKSDLPAYLFLRICAVYFCAQDKKQLLGTTYDWKGGARPSTYEDVKRRHGKLSSLQLQKLLEAAIAIPEAEGKPAEVPPSGDEKKGQPATTVSLVSLFKPICVRDVAKVRISSSNDHPRRN